MKDIRNILFDLDGTIIEPEEGIVNSVLYALNKLGIDEKNKAELRSFIGPPLIDSFAERYELTITEASQAVNYYREFFAAKGIYQNTLYDNMHSLLQALAKEDFCLFVATSKPTVFANKIIAHYKLDHFFKDVVGSNLDNTRKDKAEIIEFLRSKFELTPNETLMIGDTKFDVIGAKRNSMKTVGVSYGHGRIEDLEDSGADYIVNSCLELQRLLLSKTA